MMEMRPSRFDLSADFEDTYNTMKQKINKDNLMLLRENPYSSCYIMFDKDRLNQVIFNFISNAIKYTPQGSITMSYKQLENGIKLSVTDTGIGISKDKQKCVFLRFQKLDDFAQGTGLGLSICKAIMDVVGGKIGFESEEGKGSTFWVWFPCDIQAQLKVE